MPSRGRGCPPVLHVGQAHFLRNFRHSLLPCRRYPRRKVPLAQNVHHAAGDVVLHTISQHCVLLVLLWHLFFPLRLGWPEAHQFCLLLWSLQLCYHRFNYLHITWPERETVHSKTVRRRSAAASQQKRGGLLRRWHQPCLNCSGTKEL